MEFDVNIINPFLLSTKNTVQMTTQMELQIGKPSAKDLNFSNESVRIILGITGQMQGQVLINIKNENAKKIASCMMMGMPVAELDDMALSAISELGNMIMGGTSTIFAQNGITTDITPPIMERGESHIIMTGFQNICVPFIYNNDTILELHIMVKKDNK